MSKKNISYSLGVDIGGSKMTAVLWNGEKALADYTLATPRDSLEHFLIMLYALLEPLLEKAKKDKIKIKGIGAGVPGTINYQEKRVAAAPNLALINGLKLGEKLKEKFSLPAEIDNDANCFIRAEAKVGAGRDFSNVYGLTLGTGIGGGWWVGGEVYRGAHGNAGEPGRLIIDGGEEMELEQAYRKLTQGNPAKLAEEAYRGDALAEKSFAEFGRLFGLSLANIVNLIDPEVIILGGGVLKARDLFFNQASNIMRSHILNPAAKKIKIIKGKLGDQAGAIGAALLFS